MNTTGIFTPWDRQEDQYGYDYLGDNCDVGNVAKLSNGDDLHLWNQRPMGGSVFIESTIVSDQVYDAITQESILQAYDLFCEAHRVDHLDQIILHGYTEAELAVILPALKTKGVPVKLLVR